MKHVYERNVEMVTRDGVVLRANVWRPTEGRAPTLLMRLPYSKELNRFVGGHRNVIPSLLAFLNAGYAVVWQDTRGAFESDGSFVPAIHERSDGLDALAWVAAQDWCDGSIGMYGASYMGMTQWAVATAGAPGLKAVAPTITAMDFYKGNWYSQGGALSLGGLMSFAALMYTLDDQRAVQRGEAVDTERLTRLASSLMDPLALSDATPVADVSLHGKGRWLDDYLAHPDFDDFWKAQDLSPSIGSVTVPVLSTVGWYDLFIAEHVADFVRVRTQAGSAEAREESRLVIGPWDHENVTGEYADRYFGRTSVGEFSDSHVAFFDRWVRGRPAATATPRVRLFVMGIDRWRDEQDWPLPDTQYVDYYLHSEGAANTNAGDGTLELDEVTAAGQDDFRYDPRNPVPTAGGALLPYVPGTLGPVDQRTVESRDDVLCYTTPVLTAPVEVTGFVNLTVFASSSAVDTDITAKLVDVFPDGKAINLCDGILRLRYRDSLSEPELMTPGEVYEVTVPMAVTSNVFLPGHRIRLDVSSSNFPHFDRNSNTGGVIAEESLEEMVVADTTVHHGGARPSRLVLPLINRVGGPLEETQESSWSASLWSRPATDDPT